MIYAQHNFIENFCNAVGSNDSDNAKEVFLSELTAIVVNFPSEVIDALQNSGVKISDTASENEIIGALSENLGYNGKLNTEIAKVILRHGEQSYAVDPVSAIAQGVGEIFKFGSNIVQGKNQKEASKQETKQAMLAYATQLNAPKPKSNTGLVIGIIAGVVVLSTVALIIFKKR